MISKFYTFTPRERRKILLEQGISEDSLNSLAGEITPETDKLDLISENVIGAFRLPLGILTGILVNGCEHIVALATEEPSVVAAVNRASRMISASGGISVSVEKPVTSAQIMVATTETDASQLYNEILEHKSEWIELSNQCDPVLISFGGGVFDIKLEILYPESEDSCREVFIVIKISVYTVDAMGANCVNTMAECLLDAIVTKYCTKYTCYRGMAILTNRAVNRMVTAKCCFLPNEAMPAEAIVRASSFAMRSPERAVTHNKGIMNGIIAAALPLGQDTRALEAAVYDYATLTGVHRPLSQWTYENGKIYGELKLPLVVGFSGGLRRIPAVEDAFKFDGIHSYTELCSVLASVGMAQNLAAIWALSTEGIQAGHMKLHQRKN